MTEVQHAPPPKFEVKSPSVKLHPRTEFAVRQGFESRTDMDGCFFRVLQKNIGKKLKDGQYEGDEKAKAKAEVAANIDGYEGGLDKRSSAILKSAIEIGEAAEGDEVIQSAVSTIIPDVRVAVVRDDKIVVEGDKKQVFSLSEWRDKLAAATPEERVKLEKEGVYAFALEEADESSQQPEESEKQSGDKVIKAQIKVQKEKISKMKREKAKKEDIESEERMLANLKIAEIADNPVGILQRVATLQALKARGVKAEGLEEALSQLELPAVRAQHELVSFLVANGVSAEAASKAAGNARIEGLAPLLANPSIRQMKGFSELIFSEKVTDKQLEELLLSLNGKKQKDREGTLGVLMFIIQEIVSAAYNTVSPDSRAA